MMFTCSKSWKKKISMLFPIFSWLSNCNSYNLKKSEEKVSQITFNLQEMLREKKLARNVLWKRGYRYFADVEREKERVFNFIRCQTNDFNKKITLNKHCWIGIHLIKKTPIFEKNVWEGGGGMPPMLRVWV